MSAVAETSIATSRPREVGAELRATLQRLSDLIEELLEENAEHTATDAYVVQLLGRIEERLGGHPIAAAPEPAEMEVVGRSQATRPRPRHHAAYGAPIYAALTVALQAMGPTSAAALAAQLNRRGLHSLEGGNLNGRNVRFLLGSGRIPVVIGHDRRGERRYQLAEETSSAPSSVAPEPARMLGT